MRGKTDSDWILTEGNVVVLYSYGTYYFPEDVTYAWWCKFENAFLIRFKRTYGIPPNNYQSLVCVNVLPRSMPAGASMELRQHFLPMEVSTTAVSTAVPRTPERGKKRQRVGADKPRTPRTPRKTTKTKHKSRRANWSRHDVARALEAALEEDENYENNMPSVGFLAPCEEELHKNVWQNVFY